MKSIRMLSFTSLAGIALFGLATQGLQAQTKPLAYWISEIEVIDAAVYQTFVDRNTPIVQAAGGSYLSRGEKIIAADGTAPKRFVVIQFDSVEKAQAYRDSAAYKEIIPARDKGSKFRAFIIEGSVNSVVGK